MKYSTLFPKSRKQEFKEDLPAGRQGLSVNAKLLTKAGFIDQLMSGSFSLLPLGLRVVAKINEIIREEMNATGAQEILMPLMHPKSIWNETGRWDKANQVMYQFEKDGKEYALSFTHEEIVLDLIRKHAQTYRDYPIKIYQFSTKFRNELRAKSGILRGREFLMKDLYSAHTSSEDLDKYYNEIKDAYVKIFNRLGLKVVITEAGGGVFTDKITHEFQVVNDAGEDEIIYCPEGDFAQNVEIAKVEEGKECDLGHGPLKRAKTIEVGNIFNFGQDYSKKMNVTFVDKNGKGQYPYFASYGIGPTRVMGTLAEVYHDDRGLIWPRSVAPYQAYLIEIQNSKLKSQNYNSKIKSFAEEVCERLEKAGIEVLFDDRDAMPAGRQVSAGEKFANADLLGFPYRLVISEKTLRQTQGKPKIEFKKRTSQETELMDIEEVIARMGEKESSV